MGIDLSEIRNRYTQHKEEEERRKQEGGGFDKKFDRLKLKEGDNWVRVLPPIGDETLPWKEGNFHFQVDPAGKRKVSCSGDDCPVCKRVRSLYDEGTDESRKKAGDIRKNTRYLFNALKHNQDGDIIDNDGKVVTDLSEFKPYLFEVGKKLWEDITGIIVEYGDITDLDGADGRIVKIKRDGTGRYTQYTVLPAKDATKLPKPERAWAKKNLHDFTDECEPMDAEEIQKIMDGETGQAPSEGGGEEKPSSGTPECYGEWEDDEPLCDKCKVNESCKLETQTAA